MSLRRRWCARSWSGKNCGRDLNASRRLDTAGDFFHEELLKQGADCSGGSTDEPVVDGQASAGAVGGGVVHVGDPCRCEIAEDVGVVWLPVAAVAFADENGCDGVEGS